MIKKIIAFALAAGASMSASAGFVQYNLSNVSLGENGTLEGFFIQDTSDNAIVYLELGNGTINGPEYDYSTVWGDTCCIRMLSAVSNIPGGPTSFRYNNQEAMYGWWYHDVQLNFTQDAPSSAILVSGSVGLWWSDLGTGSSPFPGPDQLREIRGGTVVQGNILPWLLGNLEEGRIYLNRVVPAAPPVPVPEPGSLALLVAGAVGLRRMRRG